MRCNRQRGGEPLALAFRDVAPSPVTFSASDVGAWAIDRLDTVVGDGLPSAARLDVSEGRRSQPSAPAWSLRGFTSNERYVKRNERSALTVV